MLRIVDVIDQDAGLVFALFVVPVGAEGDQPVSLDVELADGCFFYSGFGYSFRIGAGGEVNADLAPVC